MRKTTLRVAAAAAALLIALGGGMADTVAIQPLAARPMAMRVANGSGNIKQVSGASKLNDAQKKLLKEYFDSYYDTLSNLETASFSGLYASDAKKQRKSDEAVLTTMCKIRDLQKADLRLTSYSYTFSVTYVEKLESGNLLVMGEENSVQKFAAYKSVDANTYNTGHRFVMTKKDGNWVLGDHRRVDDSLTEALRGELGDSPSTSTVNKRASTLLKDAKKEVSRRQSRGKKPSSKATKADNKYNRKAAASYARKWTDNRNLKGGWPDYGHWGGNCQNLVSQALYASGIPMDTQKPGLWKWYGKTPSTAYDNQGRSPSWSGVNDFLAYVRTNDGAGLVAYADAPYYTGQVGDIIHMGTGGQWKHTVMITKVLKNSNGDVVDYLVASNTADLRDYPASAHYYTDQMLIKVYGWNDMPKSDSSEADAPGEAAESTDEPAASRAEEPEPTREEPAQSRTEYIEWEERDT